MEQRAATLVGGYGLKAPRRYYSVAIFSPRANLLTKAALISAVILVLFLGGLIWIVPVQDYNTQQNFTREQPVPFSHEHHVGGLGLDCRYCHTSVETSRFAGIPPTETCMTCHSQIWTNADMLAPVRTSFATNKPLRWTRVHDLPDFVYLQPQHPCHEGRRLRDLPRPSRPDAADAAGGSAHMGWCLDCHRNPEPNLRPRDPVFDMAWTPADRPTGRRCAGAYHIDTKNLTDCSICHR